MAHSNTVKTKLADAHRVMQACIGGRGLWASPRRYRDQCWTRDFAYAGIDYLLGHGHTKVALMHLVCLSEETGKVYLSGKNGKSFGQVPIMFLDNERRWLWSKIQKSVEGGRMSFLLKAYFEQGIGQLSPWTKDSEIMFLLALGKYRLATEGEISNDLQLDSSSYPIKVTEYVLDVLRRKSSMAGLMRGADWRDTRPDLDSAILLSNCVLLYQALTMWETADSLDLPNAPRAHRLATAIRGKFWNGSHFRDYVGSDEPRTSPDEFDTFGNALAILNGIASPEQAASILDKVQELDTDFGYRLNTVTLPPKDEAEADLMSRISQTGVIWPFVHAYMLLAALEVGRRDLAEEGFRKWTRLPGFWEYYDPENGTGHGSEDQMWSAAMYVRVAEALGHG